MPKTEHRLHPDGRVDTALHKGSHGPVAEPLSSGVRRTPGLERVARRAAGGERQHQTRMVEVGKREESAYRVSRTLEDARTTPSFEQHRRRAGGGRAPG